MPACGRMTGRPHERAPRPRARGLGPWTSLGRCCPAPPSSTPPGGAKLKVNSAYRPTDPRFRNQSFPTRHVRPTDPPRAARRSKFWVGTTDRPSLFGPARAGRKPYLINSVAFRLLAGRNDRPTDPTSTDSGQSDLPTDRPNSAPDTQSELSTARRPCHLCCVYLPYRIHTVAYCM